MRVNTTYINSTRGTSSEDVSYCRQLGSLLLCYTGFILKTPLKIHKLFTNRWNMAQKSNTKVCNSSTHPVKGHSPSLTIADALYQSKLIGSACFVISHSNLKINQSTVQSWEMQFLTDKLIVFPCAKTTKFTDPPQFSQTFKALKSVSHFSQTFKDSANP